MHKITFYLNITLLLIAHGVYGAAATIGEDAVDAGVVAASVGGSAVLTTPSTEPEAMAASGAGAGAAPTGDPAPYDFEARATEMLSKEPYKSRHASDCAITLYQVVKIEEDITHGQILMSSGTLMQTNSGKPFVLASGHIFNRPIYKEFISVRFPNDFATHAAAYRFPSLAPTETPTFEDGFVCCDDKKLPVSLMKVDGKIISYHMPYFADNDFVTLIHADGTQELFPGLKSLSEAQRAARLSLIRDYSIVFLDEYPTDIKPAELASFDETRHLKEIACTISGYGCLVEATAKGCFTQKIPDEKKPKQSFRTMTMEICSPHQPAIHLFKSQCNFDYTPTGALMEPFGTMNAVSDNNFKVVRSTLINTDPDETNITFLDVGSVGLAVPIFGGFSGASLRDDRTGKVTGTCGTNFKQSSDDYVISHGLSHILAPEKDQIHSIVAAHYAAAEARAEALKSQPYSVAATNYSLWAF